MIGGLELALPATTAAATPEFLTAALRSGGTIDAGTTVVEVRHEPPGGAPAIMGQLGRLCVVYEPEAPSAPGSLLLKLPTAIQANREAAGAFRMYEREARFYTELARGLPIRTPRCHWAQVGPGPSAGLLLEYLGAWSAADQVLGVRVDLAYRAVDALARLHASSWGAPALDAIPWLPRLDEPAHLPFGELYRAAWPAFLAAYGELLPPGADRFGRVAAERVPELMATATAEAPAALCHGDFRADNLLFGELEVAVLDWQVVHRGPALEDVAVFLTQSLDVDTRRRHERELVWAWHAAVASAVPGGLADYPPELAWTHYRRLAAFATVYPVVVGAMLDPGTDRNRELFATMAVRSFTAALDLGAAEFMD